MHRCVASSSARARISSFVLAGVVGSRTKSTAAALAKFAVHGVGRSGAAAGFVSAPTFVARRLVVNPFDRAQTMYSSIRRCMSTNPGNGFAVADVAVDSSAADTTKSTNVRDNASPLEDFDLDQQILHNLARDNVTSLFPVQAKTYQLVKDNKDMIIKSPTGSGKTLAFVLPIVNEMLKVSASGIYVSACVVLARWCRGWRASNQRRLCHR